MINNEKWQMRQHIKRYGGMSKAAANYVCEFTCI